MPESPAALARDLIADIGRAGAVRWLLGLAARETTPRRSWRAVRLIIAVLFSRP